MSSEEPATQIAPVEFPQMVSTVKLPILKKGEYTLWSMRMEQYLTNTDYSLWQVILNGDGPIQVTTDEKGVETEVPPKTAQALLARQRERKAKSIMLLAILDEYQLRFHGIKDAKSMWVAIKKGLDKAYDRFQKLISLLEVHGAAVSNEDANQKFLRALPSSWNNVDPDLYEGLSDFIRKTRRKLSSMGKEPVGCDKTKVECFNSSRRAILQGNMDWDLNGYHLNENDSSGSELFNSIFDTRSNDGDDNQTNDRFKKDNGYHAVPSPLTGNYMPPLADLSFAGLDDYVYRPTTNKTSASVSQVEASITPPSNTKWSGRVPVSTAKQSSLRATSSTSTFRPVNTATHTNRGNPQQALKNKGIFDSGCSRHMTGNKDFLTDYQELDGGFVAFGGSARGGKITGKGKIRTDKLDFEMCSLVKNKV
ncbi:hypothetical protein Tco_1499059 [Tanacetum coccineum]